MEYEFCCVWGQETNKQNKENFIQTVMAQSCHSKSSLSLCQYFCNSEEVVVSKIPDFAKIVSLDNLFRLIGHIQES